MNKKKRYDYICIMEICCKRKYHLVCQPISGCLSNLGIKTKGSGLKKIKVIDHRYNVYNLELVADEDGIILVDLTSEIFPSGFWNAYGTYKFIVDSENFFICGYNYDGLIIRPYKSENTVDTEIISLENENCN